jgi:glycosyltransferase involved in cell wall biosynthesis
MSDPRRGPSHIVVDALAARFGGAAYAAVRIAQGMANETDAELTVVARKGSIVERGLLQADRVRLHSLRPAQRAELVRRIGWEAVRLPAIANRRPGTRVLSWSGMLPRSLGVPTSCYLANPLVFARDDPVNLLRRRALARTVGWASHVLVPSHAMRTLLERIPGCRPEVVPLGVDHNCFKGAAGGTEILCVADFYRHKCHDLLLDAWERLPAPRPLLRLVGEPLVDAHHAQRLLARLSPYRRRGEILVDSRLSLDELVDAYRRARVFVLTSEQESFCMPLLEAQACEVPAVVRDLPALRETGSAGTTFVRGNEPDDWAGAVARLLHDGTHHTESAAAGRAHSLNYTWERTVREICQRMLP